MKRNKKEEAMNTNLKENRVLHILHRRQRERERESLNLLRLKRWREAKEDFKKKGRTKLLGPEPCLLEGWEKERGEDVSEGSSIEHYPNACFASAAK